MIIVRIKILENPLKNLKKIIKKFVEVKREKEELKPYNSNQIQKAQY